MTSPALTGRLTRTGGAIRDHNDWEGTLHLQGRTLSVTLPTGKLAYQGTATVTDGRLTCDLLCVITGMGWRIEGVKDRDTYTLEGFALPVPAAYAIPGVDESIP